MGCYKSKRIECTQNIADMKWWQTKTHTHTLTCMHNEEKRSKTERRREERENIPINWKISSMYLRCASEEFLLGRKFTLGRLVSILRFFSWTCSDTWLCLSRYFIERAIEQKIVLWFLALIVTWIFSRSDLHMHNLNHE